MKLEVLISIFVSIFLIYAVSKIQAEEEDIGDEECKTTILTLVEKQLDSIKYCLKTMHFETKREKASKMMCVMKCSMMKEGFLEADGSLNVEGSLGLLSGFSTKVQTKILDYLMKNCNKYVQEIDPEQESCRSYEPMIRCCHDMLNQVCG